MNWLLIIVFAIIVINALIGRKVGLIKIVFSLFSFIVALLLTTWISPTVNDILVKNESFYQKTSLKVEDILFSEGESTDNIQSKDEKTIIDNLPLPKAIKETLEENKEKQEINIKSYITSHVTKIVINALAFVLTFVVIFIGLWVLSIVLNIISKLPILSQINKIAGLFVGGVQGLIIVWIFFVVLTFLGSSEWGVKAFEQINSNSILTFLYDKNVLLDIVMGAVNMFI